MKKVFIVDRFEGDYAILECGQNIYDIPIGFLPETAKEGSTIEVICQETPKKKYEDLFEK